MYGCSFVLQANSAALMYEECLEYTQAHTYITHMHHPLEGGHAFLSTIPIPAMPSPAASMHQDTVVASCSERSRSLVSPESFQEPCLLQACDGSLLVPQALDQVGQAYDNVSNVHAHAASFMQPHQSASTSCNEAKEDLVCMEAFVAVLRRRGLHMRREQSSWSAAQAVDSLTSSPPSQKPAPKPIADEQQARNAPMQPAMPPTKGTGNRASSPLSRASSPTLMSSATSQRTGDRTEISGMPDTRTWHSAGKERAPLGSLPCSCQSYLGSMLQQQLASGTMGGSISSSSTAHIMHGSSASFRHTSQQKLTMQKVDMLLQGLQ
jgi:hypothetical protein